MSNAKQPRESGAAELLGQISAGAYDRVFRRLYLPEALEGQRRRYSRLIQGLGETADEPVFLFSIPGRTELGGNHTDHNLGKVLAASVHLDAAAAAVKRDDMLVRLESQGYGVIELDLSDLAVHPDERETSASLVRGVASWLSQNGYRFGGFSAAVHSLVPGGSGLSSSAAIEVCFAQIFNSLYNGGRISAVNMAIAGQYAENEYFGKPCGLMDQIACAHGGVVKIDFEDPDRPLVEAVDADFARAELFLGIVNTGGSHADLTEDYAAVPREMKQVAQAMGGDVLRQIPREDFLRRLPDLRKLTEVSDRALMRALHFYAENQRVDSMLAALSARRYGDYLKLVRDSGRSSMAVLQNVTPSGAVAEQNLAIISSALAEEFGDDLVIRVHGGGFEGSLQFYIGYDRAGELLESLDRYCGPDSYEMLHIRADGAVSLSALKASLPADEAGRD